MTELNITQFDVIRELHKECFIPKKDGEYSDYDFYNHLKGDEYHYFGVWEEEKIIASIAYKEMVSNSPSKYVQIFCLCVAKKHRRKGIAKDLILQIINKAKELNCYCCILVVHSENIPAINCYKSMSFEEYEVIPNDFPDGKSGSAMVFYI